MAEPRFYTLEDYENIIFNGLNYSLPAEIIHNMMDLQQKLGIQPITERSRERPKEHPGHRQKNHYNHNHHTRNNFEQPMEFNIKKMPNGIFDSTSEKPKEKTSESTMDADISLIRIALNKISKGNYETQKTAIFNIIIPYIDSGDNASILKIATIIIEISSTNKFLSDLTAKLYGELIALSAEFQSVLDELIDSYRHSYELPILRCPEEERRNKQNDKRKAMTTFLSCLMKEGVVKKETVQQILSELLALVEKYMDQAGHQYTNDEITENVFLFVSLGQSIFSGVESKIAQANFFETLGQWDSIYDTLAKLSELKSADKKSLTNRAIFKYKDLMDLL